MTNDSNNTISPGITLTTLQNTINTQSNLIEFLTRNNNQVLKILNDHKKDMETVVCRLERRIDELGRKVENLKTTDPTAVEFAVINNMMNALGGRHHHGPPHPYIWTGPNSTFIPALTIQPPQGTMGPNGIFSPPASPIPSMTPSLFSPELLVGMGMLRYDKTGTDEEGRPVYGLVPNIPKQQEQEPSTPFNLPPDHPIVKDILKNEKEKLEAAMESPQLEQAKIQLNQERRDIEDKELAAMVENLQALRDNLIGLKSALNGIGKEEDDNTIESQILKDLAEVSKPIGEGTVGNPLSTKEFLEGFGNA